MIPVLWRDVSPQSAQPCERRRQLARQCHTFILGQKPPDLDLAVAAAQGQIVRHGTARGVQMHRHPVGVRLPPLFGPVCRAVQQDGTLWRKAEVLGYVFR